MKNQKEIKKQNAKKYNIVPGILERTITIMYYIDLDGIKATSGIRVGIDLEITEDMMTNIDEYMDSYEDWREPDPDDISIYTEPYGFWNTSGTSVRYDTPVELTAHEMIEEMCEVDENVFEDVFYYTDDSYLNKIQEVDTDTVEIEGKTYNYTITRVLENISDEMLYPDYSSVDEYCKELDNE